MNKIFVQFGTRNLLIKLKSKLLEWSDKVQHNEWIIQGCGEGYHNSDLKERALCHDTKQSGLFRYWMT